jgi:hypothetical protein
MFQRCTGGSILRCRGALEVIQNVAEVYWKFCTVCKRCTGGSILSCRGAQEVLSYGVELH